MQGDVVFLVIIGCCGLIFSMYNLVCVLWQWHKTVKAEGTIVSIYMPNQVNNFRNSKWAEVRYSADGKVYTSENRVQVPVVSQVGDMVQVRYDIANPTRLYSCSLTRMVVALSLSTICFTAAALLYAGIL